MPKKKQNEENTSSLPTTVSELPSNLILFLRKSCKDNDIILEENNLQFTYSTEINVPDAFDENINKFTELNSTSINSSQNSVKLHCLHCFREIKEKYEIPIRKKNNVFECAGVYCSLNCCAYDVIASNNLTSYHLLHEMYSMSERIEPSPAKETLKIFGGTLTYEQFHSGAMYKMVQHPFISLKNDLDEIIDDNYDDDDDDDNYDDDNNNDNDNEIEKGTTKTLEDFFNC